MITIDVSRFCRGQLTEWKGIYEINASAFKAEDSEKNDSPKFTGISSTSPTNLHKYGKDEHLAQLHFKVLNKFLVQWLD